jgi:hypothetical protein
MHRYSPRPWGALPEIHKDKIIRYRKEMYKEINQDKISRLMK